jgi:hypothetical protein
MPRGFSLHAFEYSSENRSPGKKVDPGLKLSRNFGSRTIVA